MDGLLFEVRSSPSVSAYAETLGAADEAELGRVITLLRLNPWPDGILKFGFAAFDAPDALLYDDTEWLIIYRVRDAVIQLLAAWRRTSAET